MLAHLPQSTASTVSSAQPRDVTGPMPSDQARLEWLRRIEARCRSMPRDDLFRACAMLGGDGAKLALDSLATALFRTLPRVLPSGRLQLYQTGARERSFDEDWLLSALAAAGRGDTDSLAFLLARRVPAHARRQVGFLIGTLSRALDKSV